MSASKRAPAARRHVVATLCVTAQTFCLLPSAVAHCSTVSLAGGPLHISPHSSSGPLVIREIGGQTVENVQVGTGFEALPADTLLLTFDCERNENLKYRFAFGIPPTHELEGTDALAAYGVVGKGQQWSPTLLAIWTFGAATQAVRPFVGAGLNYTFFRHARITNESFVHQMFGPNAVASVRLTRSWNPVATAGLSFPLSRRWSIEAAASYLPLRATATVDVDNTALGAPVRLTAELKNRSLASSLTLGYRWDR